MSTITAIGGPDVHDLDAEAEHMAEAIAAIQHAHAHFEQIKGRQNWSSVGMSLGLVETRIARIARAENEAAAEIVRQRVRAEDRARRQRDELAALGVTSETQRSDQRGAFAEAVAAVEARPIRTARAVKTDGKVQAVADALKSGDHRNHGAVAESLALSRGELSRCKALALSRGLLSLPEVRFADGLAD